MTFQTAVESLKLTLSDAPPGIYFAGNPHSGTYGKWNLALVAAGFKRVPGCALNRVWGGWQNYKGPGTKSTYLNAEHQKPWNSPDGFDKWIHAFYFIKDGLKGFVEMDFGPKFRNLQATSGDADVGTPGSLGSLWHINYMGGRNIRDVGGKPRFCSKFGRLSKSCGIAMGHGLPECGRELDEEFFTIAALEDSKRFPEGWVPFLNYGGLRWATNLKKLDTAQMQCPHAMEALPD